MGGSSAGTMAAVMAMPLGRVGGKGCSGGWLGRGLCHWQQLCPDPDLEACARRGGPGCLFVARVSCRAKTPRFGADDGDACGRRSPLEDVVVVLLSVPEFWVKTLVRLGLGSGDALRRLPS